MRLNLFFLLAALNWLLFGLGGLLAPQFIFPDGSALVHSLLREFGALVFFMGLLAWLARGFEDKSARKSVALVLLLAYASSAIFTITSSLSGASPSGDIYYAVIDFVIAGGLAWYGYLRPE